MSLYKLQNLIIIPQELIDLEKQRQISKIKFKKRRWP